MTANNERLMPARAIVDGTILSWSCSVCGHPILDREGYITVDVRAADDRHAAAEAVLASTGTRFTLESGEVVTSHTVDELLRVPDEVPWYALHDNCDPDRDSNDYWVAIERVRTLLNLIHWTAHLLEKTWFNDTTWVDILRGVGSQGGDR